MSSLASSSSEEDLERKGHEEEAVPSGSEAAHEHNVGSESLYADVFDHDDAGGKDVFASKLCRKDYFIAVLCMLLLLTLGVLIGQNMSSSNGGFFVPRNETGQGSHGIVTQPPHGSPNEFQDAKFSKSHAEAVKKEVNKIFDTLKGYYGGHYDMMDNAWTYNSQKKDEKSKMFMEHMAEVMAQALVADDEDSFIIGAIGSSVSMGHDNCFYDNYENQLQRFWEPVWKAAGMDLEVRTAGQGGSCGDSFKNQVFCLKQSAGSDCNIVHYSWTYFEHRGEEAPFHDLMFRSAMLLEKSPPAHFYKTGGSWNSQTNRLDCYGGSKLNDDYPGYGYNAICQEAGLTSGGHYTGKEWGRVGDGYHNTTRYGAQVKNKERQDSLGVEFRNWHPGPLGFEYVSDAMANLYSHNVLDAVTLIEEEWAAGRDPRKTFKRKLFSIKNDRPGPVYCDPRLCNNEEPPECLNFEIPVFGPHGARIEDPQNNLNPYLGMKQEWVLKPQPKVDYKMSSKADLLYAEKFDPDLECGFPDHCGGIHAPKGPENGHVVFRLPKMTQGIIIVCVLGKADEFLESEFLNIEIDQKPIDKSTIKSQCQKCMYILDGWPEDLHDDAGHIYLAFNWKEGATDEKVFANAIDKIITI